ncbi:MAG: aldehyde dehydrogenase family protein [Actinomycetota bacterium]
MATRTAKTTRPRTRAKKLKSFNPTTGDVMRQITTTDPAEVPEIVAQARKVAPEWAATPLEGRVHMLREVRYRIYDKMDDIVTTVAAECGKPQAEALAHDVFPPLMMLAYLERAAARALQPQKVGRVPGLLFGVSSRIEWRPFGVVGCITPWNYPVTNCFLAFAPALFAGNCVVVKPSEVTPACGELIRDVLEPLPSGVATVIQGGGDVGAALVDAPCDKISFIGSPPTGRKICAAAAKHLTPVVMELGGKDSAIVCDDADLEVASSGVLWGAFFNAGQTCCSIERAYVVDSVADDFKQRLVGKLGRVRQGRDLDVGSLTFVRQLGIVERHVSDAVEKGATVLAGGPEAGIKNADGTLWYAPTILENVDEEMDVVKEETFGPVLVLTRVRDEEEAVRRANEDGVNLTASVWTSDRKKADSLMRRLRAGSVGSNEHGVLPGMPWGPWGGVGESGFGRLNGELGIREFTIPTHVAHNLTPKMKKLYWYPYDEDSAAAFRALATVLGARGLPAKAGAVKDLLGAFGRVVKTRL